MDIKDRLYNDIQVVKHFPEFFKKSIWGWIIGIVCGGLSVLQFTMTGNSASLGFEIFALATLLLGLLLGTCAVCLGYFLPSALLKKGLQRIGKEFYHWGWAGSTPMTGLLFFILPYDGKLSHPVMIFALAIIFTLSFGSYVLGKICTDSTLSMNKNKNSTLFAVTVFFASAALIVYLLNTYPFSK